MSGKLDYAASSVVVCFIGVMAAVTSDTWATEIGSLSRKSPRSVLTWKVLTPGASGGVSMLGSLAAAIGGIVIGAFAFCFAWISGLEQTSWVGWTLLGLVGGLAGAFADSYLGATVQRCIAAQYVAERLKFMNIVVSQQYRLGAGPG